MLHFDISRGSATSSRPDERKHLVSPLQSDPSETLRSGERDCRQERGASEKPFERRGGAEEGGWTWTWFAVTRCKLDHGLSAEAGMCVPRVRQERAWLNHGFGHDVWQVNGSPVLSVSPKRRPISPTFAGKTVCTCTTYQLHWWPSAYRSWAARGDRPSWSSRCARFRGVWEDRDQLSRRVGW